MITEMMDFGSAQKYLDQYISYEIVRDFDYEKDFGLKRVSNFLDQWVPNWSTLKVIHVGGSKGKGTVSKMVSDYLVKEGKCVGLFLSPHVVSVCERISVDGEMISRENFAAVVSDFAEFVGDSCELSWFEIFFVLAMKVFVEKGCEFAVLEVGLGGRLDATNVVKPIVTAITSVEMEHADILGDTLEKIFEEKWGIKKSGVPMICEENLRKFVGEREAEFAEGNEGVARAVLGKLGFEARDLVGNFKMVGRFDVRELEGKTVVFDIAHTVKSLERLLVSLEERFIDEKKVFLVGKLNDKGDFVKVFEGKEVRFVGGFSERAMEGEDYSVVFEEVLANIKKDQIIVVTGSSYLVGAIIRRFLPS